MPTLRSKWWLKDKTSYRYVWPIVCFDLSYFYRFSFIWFASLFNRFLNSFFRSVQRKRCWLAAHFSDNIQNICDIPYAISLIHMRHMQKMVWIPYALKNNRRFFNVCKRTQQSVLIDLTFDWNRNVWCQNASHEPVRLQHIQKQTKKCSLLES